MWPGLFFCPDFLLSLYNLIVFSIRALPKNGGFLEGVSYRKWDSIYMDIEYKNSFHLTNSIL